jgi:hypothetical protein
MPGIERIPLWVRRVVSWALFVVVVTAFASLLTDRAFTFAGGRSSA